MCLKWLAVGVEPFESLQPSLFLQFLSHNIKTALVISIEPFHLLLRQHVAGNHLALLSKHHMLHAIVSELVNAKRRCCWCCFCPYLNWDEGYIFQAQESFVLCRLLNKNAVLNPDAKVILAIKPRFVGDNHPFLQGKLICSFSKGDANGSLMDIEEGANTMPRPMRKVEPCTPAQVNSIITIYLYTCVHGTQSDNKPQKLSSKRVQTAASCSFGKNGFCKSNVTLQDECEALLLLLCWSPKVHCPCDISCSIQILSTAVQEIHTLVVNSVTRVWLWFVVDDGTVTTNRADGIKTQTHKVLLLTSELGDNIRCVTLCQL
eukprot:m.31477 g.31477  ORF g.31477 m.31477 type:complete len:318 (-) comp9698_c0_seq8:1089-2042(-)